jgi:cell division protease FtsH
VSKKLKTLLVWTALVVCCLLLYQLQGASSVAPQLEWPVFVESVENGAVTSVRVAGNELTVTLHGGYEFTALGVLDDALMRQLSEHGVLVEVGEESDPFRTILIAAVPVLLLLLGVVYFLRKVQGGGANILEIRKSRARLVSEKAGVTFADVGGCEQAKEQLGDLIDFLKHPERWTGAGVRLPRGVLLEGPPGCGKTLLARAVAGETDARFWLVSASEFVEMFVGVGAARVRDMFEIAAKQAPSVIFIDELDAVGRRRGSGVGAAHDEREQTLNQLLVSLDGFARNDRVVVIAATNRADILDPALLRPGRFDRRIRIGALTRAERLDVLRIHTRNKALAADVSLDLLAERTEGSSGADLESLVNEAGLLAVRRARSRGDGADGKVVVTAADFEEALAPRGAPARFDRVDALLIESTTQLAQPTGRAVVRATLLDGAVLEGELVWADASYLKLRGGSPGNGAERIVPKSQVKSLEALAGTGAAADGDVVTDVWAARPPGVA